LPGKLPLFDVPAKAPSTSEREILALTMALRGRGWVTAKQLGLHERKVRALASASHGQVLGGPKGYALTRDVSDDEADHAEARLISQAKKMMQRAADIRSARNRRQSAA
jgi:hypothetical protein